MVVCKIDTGINVS